MNGYTLQRNVNQISRNIITNVAVFGLNAIISLWSIPYLISHLGVEGYGLIPLASQVVSYLTLVTLSLNGAIGRFIALDIQKKDLVSAIKTFNTALTSGAALSLLLLPFVALIVIGLPYIFKIPSGLLGEAQILFILVIGRFIITIYEGIFSTSSWALSRFDLRNIAIGISKLSYPLLLILTFGVIKPSLSSVGISIFLSGLIGLIGCIFLWRTLSPFLLIDFRKFDHIRIKEFFSIGGWMMVDQIGSLLFLSSDLIIINAYLGTKSGGEYGSILVISSTLRVLVLTISNVFTPIMIANYAKGDISTLVSISKDLIKYSSLLLAIPVGLLVGTSKEFLGLWLGPPFSSLYIILIVMLFHHPINLSVLPLQGIQVTLNKVRIPGVATLIVGVLNAILSVVLIQKWGVLGVALSCAITLSIKSIFFTLFYNEKILNIPNLTLIKELAPGVLSTLIFSVITFIISEIIHPATWVTLFIEVLSLGLLFLGVLYYLFMKPELKRLTKDYWGNRQSKISLEVNLSID